MRYLVIGIHPATGAAIPVLETVLPTRPEALSALRQLVSSEEPIVEGYDLYLVDLEAATPVLLLRAPASDESASEVSTPHAPRIAGETAASPEMSLQHEPDTEDVFAAEAELEPVVAHVSEEHPASDVSFHAPSYSEPVAPAESATDLDQDALLEALRRAADSLVQQGVEVPAPTIHEAEVTVPAATMAKETTAAEGSAPDAGDGFVADSAPQLEAESSAGPSVAEPLGVAVPPAEPATPAAEPVFPTVDVAQDLEPVRPVIMGEYPEEVSTVAVPTVSEGSTEPQVKPYEPSGELEIEAYTCKDCVYFNTCPKAGESTPAECGTFQWRSF